MAQRTKQVAARGYSFGARVDARLGSRAPGEVKPIVQATLRATNPEGFLKAVKQSLTGFHSPDHAAKFTMPMLLIEGSEDKVNPFDKNGAIFIKAVPAAKVERLEGYGHLTEVETPETVNKLIRAFFGG